MSNYQQNVMNDGETPKEDVDALHQQMVDEGLMPPDSDAPEIPEKFRNEDGSLNAEALLQSYRELEKRQGSKETSEETPQPKEPSENERKAAQEATEKAGLNLAEVSKEWMDNGTLSDDTYKALEDAGYPKDMVDTYIRGLTGSVAEARQAVFEAVGGEEAYGDMLDWAANNWSEAEINAYDRAVESGDQGQIMLAVRSLKAAYDSAGDQDPQMQITGKGSAKADVYASNEEYLEDFMDPKYDSSPTFRKRVQEKALRSNIW